ncbi:MAG: LAGLIDADG family homing endonuclease [archaeon]
MATINYYLNLNKNVQKLILRDIKIRTKKSYATLAKKLKVTRGMVIKYVNGMHKIPLVKFFILCNLAEIPTSKYSKLPLLEIRNKLKHIKIPKCNEKLAEFLGALYGDGCITTNYAIAIGSNAISDKKYILTVICPLFKSLFNVNPSIRFTGKNKSQILAMVYSKELQEFLVNNFGFPIGKKKNKITIPKKIIEKKALKIGFIRGVFDTDGGFHRHNPKSAKIEITSHSRKFLKEIFEVLKELKLQPFMLQKQVYVIAKSKIDEFFRVVRPHNPKHLYKYFKYKETGQVPRHKDIEYANIDFFKT